MNRYVNLNCAHSMVSYMHHIDLKPKMRRSGWQVILVNEGNILKKNIDLMKMFLADEAFFKSKVIVRTPSSPCVFKALCLQPGLTFFRHRVFVQKCPLA